MNDLPKLDELLERLGETDEPEDATIVQEHLRSARDYLLGGMPSEYEWSLGLAHGRLDEIRDSGKRRQVQETLDELLRHIREPTA